MSKIKQIYATSIIVLVAAIFLAVGQASAHSDIQADASGKSFSSNKGGGSSYESSSFSKSKAEAHVEVEVKDDHSHDHSSGCDHDCDHDTNHDSNHKTTVYKKVVNVENVRQLPVTGSSLLGLLGLALVAGLVVVGIVRANRKRLAK